MPAKRSRKKISILFVCTGNTCRSPLAECLLRERIGHEELEHRVEVSSAGLIAMEGAPASPMAVAIAADNGLELGVHRSRQLTEKMLSGTDLVIGMQLNHISPLEPLQNKGKPEYCLLVKFCGSGSNSVSGIPDPFGADRAAYERTFATIAQCIDCLIVDIKQKLDANSGKRRNRKVSG